MIDNEEVETEIDTIRELMGLTSDWRLQNMKEIAMCRCLVKNSRRKHHEKVINEFIVLLKESK